MSLRISIILVSPENPDNIGAVARAMKNMGLRDLRLVLPPSDWKVKGRKLAMSAGDVLGSAQTYKRLREAVADARFVVGTTRRLGPRRGLFVGFQKGIQKIRLVSHRQRVAILFGKESKGLDNQALALCDWVLSIPADDAYPSLNLAQAVMVVAFSLFVEKNPKRLLTPIFCTKRDTEDVLEHFRRALQALDYDQGKGLIERILATLHGIFKRNGMREPEAQMMKGLARTIIGKLRKSKKL